MAVFLLIHGAWHGAACWHRVAPLLSDRGHEVVTPDLPGHGEDKTPLEALSLDAYVERVGESLATAPEPAIVLGHSQSGMVVTRAAERYPERFRMAVYLAAFLTRSGQSIVNVLRENNLKLPLPYLNVSPDRSYTTAKLEAMREYLYHDCPADELVRAETFLSPEPMSLSMESVTTTGKYESVPRAYMECLRDRAIPLPVQRAMYTAVPCDRVVSLDTGHLPHIAAPEQFVAALAFLT